MGRRREACLRVPESATRIESETDRVSKWLGRDGPGGRLGMAEKKRQAGIFRLIGIAAMAATAGAGVVMLNGCSSSIPNRNPVGEAFPSVEGKSLEKAATRLPEDLAGKPAVLLIGYKQKTQFDIDRWLMGLLQAGVGTEVDVQLLEIPTIPGLLPTMASGWIDNGMRSGIPEEDWGAVVTLYGDAAEPVARMTGTENGRLARIVVLDPEGRVVWFDDAGYGVKKAMAVAELVGSYREN